MYKFIIKMSISHHVGGGRFGNNLFKYFATKVIGKYTNKTYRHNYRSCNHFINDSTYKQAYEYCVKNPNSLEGDIFLDGYFQTDFWVVKEREFLNSLMTIENTDKFNDEYCIKDIAEALKNFDKSMFGDNTLTVHIRLDDFFHKNENSEVLDPDFLRDYISNVMTENNFTKCVFIVDELRKEWEKKYMDKLLSIPNSLKITNDLLTDFCILFYSPNLMVCRSTFAWAASACSIYNKKIWLPLKQNTHSHQVFNTLGENTITFTPSYMTKY
jgi:hypothetical protein